METEGALQFADVAVGKSRGLHQHKCLLMGDTHEGK